MTVTKLPVPNSDTTPSAASTAAAKGGPAASASAADETLIISGSAASRSNLRAFGFGLAPGEGVAVAIRCSVGPRLERIPPPAALAGQPGRPARPAAADTSSTATRTASLMASSVDRAEASPPPNRQST